MNTWENCYASSPVKGSPAYFGQKLTTDLAFDGKTSA